MYVSVT